MKWCVSIMLIAMGCLSDGALAEPATSTDQAAFQQLFRSWQKGAARSVPVRAPRAGRRPLSSTSRVAGTIITSPMGMRVNPITGQRMLHAGADLAAPWGAGVHATADGVVMHARSAGSYGLLVTLHHAGGYETRYAHMSRILVVPGQKVRKGELVGQVGSTGRSTGPHLHYEIRQRGQAIDPLPSIGH